MGKRTKKKTKASTPNNPKNRSPANLPVSQITPKSESAVRLHFIEGIVDELPSFDLEWMGRFPGVRKVLLQLVNNEIDSSRLKMKKRTGQMGFFTVRATKGARVMLASLPGGELVPFAVSETHNYAISKWKNPKIVQNRIQSALEGGAPLIPVSENDLCLSGAHSDQGVAPVEGLGDEQDLLELVPLEISHRNQFVILDPSQMAMTEKFLGEQEGASRSALALPRALIGAPGTGKTLLMYLWFANSIHMADEQERGRFRYIAPHAAGAKDLWNEFKAAYPEFNGDNPFEDMACFLDIPVEKVANQSTLEAWLDEKTMDSKSLSLTPGQLYREFQSIHAIRIQALLNERPFREALTQEGQEYPEPLRRAYQSYRQGLGKRVSYAHSNQDLRLRVFNLYVEYLGYLSARGLEDPELPTDDTAVNGRAKSRQMSLLCVDEFQLMGNVPCHLLGPNLIVSGDPHQERYGGLSNLEYQLKSLGISNANIDTLTTQHRAKPNITRMQRMSLVLDDIVSEGRSRETYTEVLDNQQSLQGLPGSVEWLEISEPKSSGSLKKGEIDVDGLHHLLSNDSVVLVPNAEKEREFKALCAKNVPVVLLSQFHGSEAPFVVLYGVFDEGSSNGAEMRQIAEIIRGQNLSAKKLDEMELRKSRSKDKARATTHGDAIGLVSNWVVELSRAQERMVILSTRKEQHDVRRLLKEMAELCAGEFDPANLHLSEDDAYKLIQGVLRQGDHVRAQALYHQMLSDRDTNQNLREKLWPKPQPKGQPMPTHFGRAKETAPDAVDHESLVAFDVNTATTLLLEEGIEPYLAYLWKNWIKKLPIANRLDAFLSPGNGLDDLAIAVNKTGENKADFNDRCIEYTLKTIRELSNFLHSHFQWSDIMPNSISDAKVRSGEYDNRPSVFSHFVKHNDKTGFLALLLENLRFPRNFELRLFEHYPVESGAPRIAIQQLQDAQVSLEELELTTKLKMNFKASSYTLRYNTVFGDVKAIELLANSTDFLEEVLKCNHQFFKNLTRDGLYERSLSLQRGALNLRKVNALSVDESPKELIKLSLFSLLSHLGRYTEKFNLIHKLLSKADKAQEGPFQHNARALTKVALPIPADKLLEPGITEAGSLDHTLSPLIGGMICGYKKSCEKIVSSALKSGKVSSDIRLDFCRHYFSLFELGNGSLTNDVSELLALLVKLDKGFLEALNFYKREKPEESGVSAIPVLADLINMSDLSETLMKEVLRKPNLVQAIKKETQVSPYAMMLYFVAVQQAVGLSKVFRNIVDASVPTDLPALNAFFEAQTETDFQSLFELIDVGTEPSGHLNKKTNFIVTTLGSDDDLSFARFIARDPRYAACLGKGILNNRRQMSTAKVFVKNFRLPFVHLLIGISVNGMRENQKEFLQNVPSILSLLWMSELCSIKDISGVAQLGDILRDENFPKLLSVLFQYEPYRREWETYFYTDRPLHSPTKDALETLCATINGDLTAIQKMIKSERQLISIIKILTDNRYVDWIRNTPLQMITKWFFGKLPEELDVNTFFDCRGGITPAPKWPIFALLLNLPNGRLLIERLHIESTSFREHFDALLIPQSNQQVVLESLRLDVATNATVIQQLKALIVEGQFPYIHYEKRKAPLDEAALCPRNSLLPQYEVNCEETLRSNRADSLGELDDEAYNDAVIPNRAHRLFDAY